MAQGYEHTVEINVLVVDAIDRYWLSGDPSHLVIVQELLTGITDQEIRKTIRNLHLSRDLVDDMRQEAFIKLQEVANWSYSKERCPVFITFWRTSLYRHLLSRYHRPKHKRTEPLPPETEIEGPSSDPENKIFIQELRAKYALEIEAWTGFYRDMIPFGLAILDERIFPESGISTPQDELARRFERSQGYLSKWETWLIEKIRTENPLI